MISGARCPDRSDNDVTNKTCARCPPARLYESLRERCQRWEAVGWGVVRYDCTLLMATLMATTEVSEWCHGGDDRKWRFWLDCLTKYYVVLGGGRVCR